MFETTVRYNNNNNKHPVETQPGFYDSLLFEPHLVAYTSKATRRRIYRLTGSADIDYYIDPGMAEFERGQNFRGEDGEISDWTRTYIQQVGDPLPRILRERGNVNPEQINDSEIEQIAKSVVDFQETFATDVVEGDLGDFIDIDAPPAQPRKVIPWYNKIDDADKILTTKKILSASDSRATIEMKPCIYTTKQLVKEAGTRSRLIDIVEDLGVSECFLIIEDLDKSYTDQSTYEKVIEFVYDIRKRGVVPHFLYGDYFSHLLAYFGLGGTTYGTLYAEDHVEELKSTDGGGFPNRYYFDSIKSFVKPPAAADLGMRTGAQFCNCPVCSRHFDGWQDMAEKVGEKDEDEDTPFEFEEMEDNPSVRNLKTILQKHYLAMRWRHTQQIQSSSFEDTLSEIQEGFDETVTAYGRSYQVNNDSDLNYMMCWLKAAESRERLAFKTLNDMRTGF